MIMIRTIFLAFVLLGSTVLMAQNSLEIEITGLRNNKGQVSLELMNKDKETVKGVSKVIFDNKCIIKFDKLKEGEYAVRYFHDENLNRKLDKKFFFIPKEGYGFSNNAYSKFGPKDFKHWLFEVKGKKKIKLQPSYL